MRVIFNFFYIYIFIYITHRHTHTQKRRSRIFLRLSRCFILIFIFCVFISFVSVATAIRSLEQNKNIYMRYGNKNYIHLEQFLWFICGYGYEYAYWERKKCSRRKSRKRKQTKTKFFFIVNRFTVERNGSNAEFKRCLSVDVCRKIENWSFVTPPPPVLQIHL